MSKEKKLHFFTAVNVLLVPCYFSVNSAVFINSQGNWFCMKQQSVSIYKHAIVWKDSITEKWARRRELDWKQQRAATSDAAEASWLSGLKHTHSGDTQMQYGHTFTWMHMHKHTHTHTQRVGFAFAVPFLGSCSHQPGLTPRLSVAVTAVSLWINMDGAAPSTTHTGPNNKTSKSLSPVRLPHARRGLPWSSHILSGLLLDLHSPFVALFKKSPVTIKSF